MSGLTLSGRIESVTERDATSTRTGETWKVRQARVVTMGATYYVELADKFDGTLTEGTEQTIEVSVRAYISNGKPGYGFKGWRVVEPERAGIRAAS